MAWDFCESLKVVLDLFMHNGSFVGPRVAAKGIFELWSCLFCAGLLVYENNMIVLHFLQ